MIIPRLPSRYEDIDTSYRGRLLPNNQLLSLVDMAKKSMNISGGIRFLPIYGKSGSGKSCASHEIGTHLPETYVFSLDKNEIESREYLLKRIDIEKTNAAGRLLIAIIDQYEENVLGKEKIPSQFIEHLSILDRAELRTTPILFIWLSTSKEFCQSLANATSRNRRILLKSDFVIEGPEKDKWIAIIQETFSVHNAEQALADYQIVESDIARIVERNETLGDAIEDVGSLLASSMEGVQNFSEYQVIIMWPVSDSLRNQRVLQFSRPREGYKLNWDIWYNHLNEDDKKQLPIKELNRARLYFDVRIIPVRAADLYKMCTNLNDDSYTIAKTYLERFKKTHFFHVLMDEWEDYDYNPVRERESNRANEAESWYRSITTKPVSIGKRVASALRQCGVAATYEKTITVNAK